MEHLNGHFLTKKYVDDTWALSSKFTVVILLLLPSVNYADIEKEHKKGGVEKIFLQEQVF